MEFMLTSKPTDPYKGKYAGTTSPLASKIGQEFEHMKSKLRKGLKQKARNY
jgi:hypothetical protein